MKISKKIDDNLNEIRNIFKDDQGVIYREFFLKNKADMKCLTVYVDGMADITMINDYIIKPLMEICPGDETSELSIMKIFNEIMPSGEIKRVLNFEDITRDVLSGNTAFLMANSDEALIVNTIGWEKRVVGEPDTEKVVRGPREAFTESLTTNLSMIRRKIKNTDFKFKFKEIGKITKTKLSICYIENIVSPKILDEVIKRLDKIKIDGYLIPGIQELIKDAPFTPFKTIGSTERPDVVAGKLLEGRVAILCDATPFAMTMPFVFLEYFQINEDYYNNFFFASINSIIRWIGFFLTTSVPAIYVAWVTFHQEMTPTPLLLSISASRQGIPFPTIVEALIMLFIFEILREAGVRIPTVVG